MSAAAPRAASATAGPASATLHPSQLLSMQAAIRPEQPFLAEGAAASWTFREVDAASEHVARLFGDLELRSGARVGLIAPNGPRAASLLFAILKAGLQPVLCPPSAALPALVAIAAAAAPAVLIVDAAAQDGGGVEAAVRLAAASDRVRFVMAFGGHAPKGVMDIGERLERGRAILDPAGERGASPADTLLFGRTDGTVARRAVERIVATAAQTARALGIMSGGRLIAPLPFADAAGLALGPGAALFAGSELALLDAPDSAALACAMEGGRPRYLVWPAKLARMAADASLKNGRLASLGLVTRAGRPDPLARLQAQGVADVVLDLALNEEGDVHISREDGDRAAAARLAS